MHQGTSYEKSAGARKIGNRQYRYTYDRMAVYSRHVSQSVRKALIVVDLVQVVS